MQRYEIKNYFGKSYASTCQHCGITIYRRNKNGNGKHVGEILKARNGKD